MRLGWFKTKSVSIRWLKCWINHRPHTLKNQSHKPGKYQKTPLRSEFLCQISENKVWKFQNWVLPSLMMVKCNWQIMMIKMMTNLFLTMTASKRVMRLKTNVTPSSWSTPFLSTSGRQKLQPYSQWIISGIQSRHNCLKLTKKIVNGNARSL